MRIREFSSFLIIFAAILTFASTSKAAWMENGAPVCLAVNWQEEPVIVADGAGGAFIVWEDQRSPDIYAQRIDEYGNPLWAEEGVQVVAGVESFKAGIVAVSDDAGYVIVAWHDYRSEVDYDIYAQRLDAAGNRLWGSEGVAVCAQSNNQIDPVIASDGAGGCIVAWKDGRPGSNYDDVYAQRLNDGGAPMWVLDGEEICLALGYQNNLAIASNGSAGAVIAWVDTRGADEDIYAQMIDGDGYVVWTVDGVPACAYSTTQFQPQIVWEDPEAICIYWFDNRNSPGWDLYAQIFDSKGGTHWGTNGYPICDSSADMQSPTAISDGAGGFFFAWGDDRNGNLDVYMQRVSSDCADYWTYNGKPACEAAGNQYPRDLVLGYDGRVMVVWQDLRTGSYDIYMQSVDIYGDQEWTTDGIPVVDVYNTQLDPSTITDGKGGVLVTWADARIGGYDIFAQRIDGNGNWGIPEPEIRAVRDVPGDQGGQVNISWNASQYDPDVALITHYTVWRAIDPEAAMMMVASGARILESEAEMPGIDELDGLAADHDLIRTSLFGTTDYYWTLVGGHDAYYLNHYSLPTSTLFDSTAVSDEYHYFQVIAHTDVPTIFYVSPPDSGYSVDNLAPCAPLPIAGEQLYAPAGLELSWTPNSEPDFDCYHVYRDIGPSFDPSPGNLMTTTCETLLLDGSWTWDSGYCYKVAAVDINGNESEYAMLCFEQVTGDDPMPLPDATFLAQNYPNPFNPNTTIAFGLKSGGFVNLSVYDAAGRLVATLINESRPAGQYATVWNGNTENGSSAASGVYFYKLVTEEFAKTRKMILLK